MGGAPPGPGGGDGITDLASLMGGGGEGGTPLPPELMKMAAAQALAPQVLAQQQSAYFKKFLTVLVSLLSELRRQKTIGPHAATDIARAQTSLQAAMAKLDKEKPEESEPVDSLLAQGMTGKPQMAAGGAPGGGLPVMR